MATITRPGPTRRFSVALIEEGVSPVIAGDAFLPEQMLDLRVGQPQVSS